MNSTIFFSVAIVCVVAAFVLFHIYRGVHGSLANATIGSVYNFRYVQPLNGTFERYLAKVVNVTKFDKYWLDRLNRTSKYRRNDDMFERSPTLVTCQMKDGTFRQFYAERTDYVRRSLLGNTLFKIGMVHLF